MPQNLQTMRENPGSVKRRDLVQALRENGWALAREGAKHEVWVKGTATVMVARALKGTGTIRRIVDLIIAAGRN